MRFTGISVRVALLALASLFVAPFSLAQQLPPVGPHATGTTHAPNVSFQTAASAGAAIINGKAPSPSGTGGTPYNVGPVVTPTTTVPEAEEYIAADPTSLYNLVAVVGDFSLRGGYDTTKYAVSFGNGAAGTWSEYFVPLLNGHPATSDSQTWEAIRNAVVAIDRQGNVYVSGVYFNYSNSANGIYVSVGQLTSPSLGLSIAGTMPVAADVSTTTNVEEDKDWIAVDNSSNPATSGNVYVSWTRFVSGGNAIICLSRSTDHGMTWSAPLQVNDAWQNGSVEGSQVAVGPGGEVYVAYEVFYENNQRGHFLVKSLDGGQTLVPLSSPLNSSAVTPLFNELTFISTYPKNSYPSLAVSPTNGNIYVVYSDQPGATAGAEVEFVLSTNGGASFSSPATLNNPSKGQQFFPAIAVDGNGEIHVSWFDTRNSFKNDSSYDIYATNSTTSGGKFSTNARVTPASINIGNTNFLGNYMGIAASAGFAHPVWTSGGFNNGLLQTSMIH